MGVCEEGGVGMSEAESAPKMRKLERMTIYTGRHWNVGYVVTKEGVWWTHQGDEGVEEDDEKAFKKAIAAIEEQHGKEQPREENKGASKDAAGAAPSGAMGRGDGREDGKE